MAKFLQLWLCFLVVQSYFEGRQNIKFYLKRKIRSRKTFMVNYDAAKLRAEKVFNEFWILGAVGLRSNKFYFCL